MKSILFSAAILALTAGSATAACSTSSLAGTWRVGVTDTGICTATVSSAGKVSGSCGTGALSVSSACKITGRVAGKTLLGRADSGGNIFIGELGGEGVAAYRQ